ncbi:MAG: metallophosphoesterase, partial [Pseudomonadota bacterium]|nr:metallophosphoesterase [Pseudomonadota bacterium]
MVKKLSFWKNLRTYLGAADETVILAPSQKLRLSGKRTRIPLSGFPVFEVEMGKQRLFLYPDLSVDTRVRTTPCDFILFDPQRYRTGISHFLRLSPGETLSIDRNTEYQRYVFSSPRDAFRRHFSVLHEGDALVFRDPVSELGTYLSLVDEEQDGFHISSRRAATLKRVSEIFGGAMQALPPEEALDTLRKVNRCLRDQSQCPKDSVGNPGGVLQLPSRLTPILLGDLHAQLDNLLKILSENTFLESLENGKAALIIIGDAIHPEQDGKLEDMHSSLLMMDLIFKLKLQFPEQVFYIVGNHDSFSHDVMKHGVMQGLLWEKHVTATRGEEYRAELELFYRQSPLVVVSQDFIACHAGPARNKISLETLVNVRQFPGIVHDITWNRIRSRRFPAGYTRSDVRRFRKGLGAESDTPF